ncbi:MFS transporter [Nisaea sp.]|uniref:MFS transporter n=1 Tax=Nisaea sp. TaxID=2024842 RepID=UPI00329A796A
MTTEKQRLLVAWTLALGMFIIGTTSLSILGVGPALTRDLEIAPGAAGWLVTAFAATFAIAAPAAQFTLRRKLTPCTLIVSGTVILVASLIWTAVATDFLSLLIARILSALGGALIAPTSSALAIASVPDERRGATLATVFAGFTLATVGGVPIVTWLTLLLDWRGAMAAIACAAVLFLVLAVVFLPKETNTTPISKPGNSQGLSF